MNPIILLLSGLVAARTLRGHIAHESPRKQADVYYVSELLDKFRQTTVRNKELSAHRHALEMQRLQGAIARVPTQKDKWALEQAAESNEEAHLESNNAFSEMVSFASTLKQMMGAKGKIESCNDLTCGKYAYCTESQFAGAKCACENGYEGDGFLCSAPTVFIAHPLTNASNTLAQELDLASFNGTKNLACVFRDSAKGDAGFLLIGETSPVQVTWTQPYAFSNGTRAFTPVVAGLPSGRVVVAYRDANDKGNGLIVGAAITPAGVTLGIPLPFARHQEHQMAVLPLPGNHVVVFYSDRIVDALGKTKERFGGVGLFVVGARGDVVLKGKLRFAEVPVTRIRAALLSSNEFVVAYRHVQNEIGVEKQEGNVVYGAFHEGEVVFDPHPISMEPDKVDVWARDLTLVSMNTFAYGYYLAGSEELKVQLVKVDPMTHRMTKKSVQVVGHGFTPFMKGVSLAFAPNEPRTYDVQSVAAQSIGDSRMCFVFTDQSHRPHFQLVGLAQ
eukprot:GEMP01033117.1.p1 GENE.GEMP01033117.1~~GEMP01033117.1.p1  ORF type:complete len:502 (+),score=121.52 GEMP01033117.1:20-1525(+)